MSFAGERAAPDRSRAPALLLGAAAAGLGLLAGWPFFLGAVVAVAGVAGSILWRRRAPASHRAAGVLPALVGLGAPAVTAPAGPAPELFAGLAALALLLWLAADPTRPRAGGRRAAPVIAACAAAVGIAFAVALAFPRIGSAVGVAGGLLAVVILVLALLLEHEASAEAPRERVDRTAREAFRP